jgi:hypothetical protein
MGEMVIRVVPSCFLLGRGCGRRRVAVEFAGDERLRQRWLRDGVRVIARRFGDRWQLGELADSAVVGRWRWRTAAAAALALGRRGNQ